MVDTDKEILKKYRQFIRESQTEKEKLINQEKYYSRLEDIHKRNAEKAAKKALKASNEKEQMRLLKTQLKHLKRAEIANQRMKKINQKLKEVD